MTKYFLLVDGGCSGNGTAAASMYYSFQIKCGDQEAIVTSVSREALNPVLGRTSNNVAEYVAVGKAMVDLATLLDDPSKADVVVLTDSALVIGHMSGGWKRKDAVLRRLAQRLDVVSKAFNSVTYRKVGRTLVEGHLGH